MKNTIVGLAQTVTVGKTRTINVGEELVVNVGGGSDKDGNATAPKAMLVMKSNGDILLKGVKIYLDGEAHVQISSAMIDNN